jgi:hypothetical protein
VIGQSTILTADYGNAALLVFLTNVLYHFGLLTIIILKLLLSLEVFCAANYGTTDN